MNNLSAIKRNTESPLPRMTPKQRREAVRLIRGICSGYDNGNCVFLDSGDAVSCPQSSSCSVICKFFRHVLLEDRDGLPLKSQIFRDSAAKECDECGRAYRSKSNNAKYCDACKRSIARRQKAAYARNRRNKLSNMTSAVQ